MQNRVYVLATDKTPLMPCHPARARELMRKGKAAVFRRYPFTIILKQETTGEVQPLAVKIDPGSKTTGFAVVAAFPKGNRLIWAAELSHRGLSIKASLESRRSIRRGRRARKTRYRKPRFSNRKRPAGWLAPSIESRVLNVQTWVSRISRLAPVSSLSVEVVKFDTQLMDNAEISGVQYQQGTLQGYEVREYLLEKWGRKCAYCGKKDLPLQIEHLIPKSRGGTNRIQNLALACEGCNQKKGTQTAAEFGHPQLMGKAKVTLRDAAAVNSTRKELAKRLRLTGLRGCPTTVETGSGGLTKFNRTLQGYPKAHFIDAACVGESGASVFLSCQLRPLLIAATGHGNRQMCGTNKYGFPTRHRPRAKSFMGFQTGDMVKANVPTGKYAGRHTGRIAIRHAPNFNLKPVKGRFAGAMIAVHPKTLITVHRNDGYAYSIAAYKRLFPSLKEGASALGLS